MNKSTLAVAMAAALGTSVAHAAPVTVSSGTFTMYDPTGAVVGGSAVVTGVLETTGLLPGVNLTSPTPFFGFKWTAHDSTFTNNGNGTVTGNHPFDWGATPNIPVVVVWDTTSVAGRWIALDGDNNGIPGTAMTAGPFTGFSPFFDVAVPIPAAAWLFGSGLLGLVGVARRRRKA